MTLLRQHRLASFLLALLAIVAFAIAELDFGMLFVGVVLAVLSWYVTEGPRGRTIPDWASNTLVVGAVAWNGFQFLMRGEVVDAMGVLGRVLVWILIVKLYARRTPSEEKQRFALATMLVVAGCLESVQFAFGLLVIAYTVVAVWSVMLWRLARSAEAARASRFATNGFAPPLEIAIGRRVLPQFRGLVAVSVLAVLCGGIGVFILFPRFAEISGGSGGRGRSSVTGFSDEIRLRRGDRITESRRELFTVRWTDPDGSPRRLLRPLLLRGAVLSWYDELGERWVANRGEAGIRTVRTPEDGKFATLSRGVPADIGPVATAQIEMRSYATEVIFSVYAPIAIATSEPRSIALDPSTLILRDVSTDRMSRYWSYELQVQQQPSAEVFDALTAGSDPTERALGFPVEAVRPIARSILEEVRRGGNLPPEPGVDTSASERFLYGREVARAIVAWMRTNFRYTTDLSAFPRVEGEDPIVSFLARYRAGHCEYFASALCAVLRSLEIESRIVTGFIAIEYDESAEQYIVRESNAHAWVEVRTGADAWMAVDATPEESLLQLQERNRSFVDGFRWIYGRLEFLWNSRVVSYDASTQSTMAGRVGTGWREAVGERFSQLLARMRAIAAELSLGSAGGAWFATIAVCISAAGLAWLIVVFRHRRLRRWLRLGTESPIEQRRLLRDAAFYVDALEALEAAGFSKPTHLTPRAWATALAGMDAVVGERFAEVAESFYMVRYGGIRTSQREATTYQSQVLALRAALRQKRRGNRVD